MDDCFLWAGRINKGGYGVITIRRRMFVAHRLIYETLVGIIPKGLFVLHKCDTPRCVNTEHLFLGTQADNMQDMYNKGRHIKVRYNADKTSCPHGHPYTIENTYNHPDGSRKCITCSKNRSHHAK